MNTIAMSVMFLRLEILIVSVGFCSGQSLTPDQAVERYLTASRNRQPECSDRAFAVQIDASLSKLKKEGRMTCIRREFTGFCSKVPEKRGFRSKLCAAVGRFPMMRPQSPSGFSL